MAQKVIETYLINNSGVLSIALICVICVLIILFVMKLFKAAVWFLITIIIVPFILVLGANFGVELLSTFPPETSAKMETSYQQFFEDTWKTTSETRDLIEKGASSYD